MLWCTSLAFTHCICLQSNTRFPLMTTLNISFSLYEVGNFSNDLQNFELFHVHYIRVCYVHFLKVMVGVEFVCGITLIEGNIGVPGFLFGILSLLIYAKPLMVALLLNISSENINSYNNRN
uniref:Uncharacterized protein n=1 Tax=Glossina brevipalpis TaxID=37001 RepID=A0A1A9WGD4_9MUSC